MANANAIVEALLFTEHPAIVVDQTLVDAIVQRYDEWEAKMQEIIDNAFPGDYVNDFWGDAECPFVFVNMGTGQSFTDYCNPGGRYYVLAKIADILARRMMPQLEFNLYVDEDGESKTLRCMGI
jgi:hypothetical protein